MHRLQTTLRTTSSRKLQNFQLKLPASAAKCQRHKYAKTIISEHALNNSSPAVVVANHEKQYDSHETSWYKSHQWGPGSLCQAVWEQGTLEAVAFFL
jgi:hypothetical protein